MSEALIASLNNRVNELQQQVATLNAESRDRRLKLRKAEKDRDEARGQVESLTKARDDWEAKAKATPGEQADRVKSLEGQLRRLGVEKALAAALKPEDLNDKVTTDHIIDALKPAGFDPSAEGAEKADFKGLVGKARESHPYLFRTAGETPAAAPDGATHRPALTLGEAGGRGARDTQAGTVHYRKSELHDPNWMTKKPHLAKALKDGTAVELPG